MRKKHYIFLPLFILIIVAVFASCGKKNDSDESRRSRGQKQVLSAQEDVEETPSPSPISDAITHLVRLDGSTLTLYEVNGENYTVVKSLDIDISYYPNEDIQELNTGIFAYSKESGFEILENFAN